MAKIFITGSTNGLGELAAKFFIAQGHEVVLHARNSERVKELSTNKGAKGICIANLTSITETIDSARQLNEMERFDTIIIMQGSTTFLNKKFLLIRLSNWLVSNVA